MGQGVWAGNITVSTAEELMTIATNVNDGTMTYSGDVITLTADIDLSDKTWVPIGNDWDNKKHFKGTFDGGGHKISNLSISTSDVYYLGVFGCVNGGTVKNLVLANSSVKSNISSSSYTDYVGGIVGYNLAGTIENCWVLSDVTIEGDDCVGGIVGYSGTSGTDKAYIKNCYNFGATVKSNNESTKGDICGKNEGEIVNGIIFSEAAGIMDAAALKGKSVTFSRTFTSSVASTICLPFQMTSVTGGTVYEFTDVTYDESKSAWVASFSDEGVSTTEAGKPYLFIPSASGAVDFSGTVVEGRYRPSSDTPTHLVLYNGTPGTSQSIHTGGDNGTWTFHGTYTKQTYGSNLTGTVYGFAAEAYDANGIAAGNFVKASGSAYVPPFRCYLTYSGSSLARSTTRGAADGLPDRIIVRLIGGNGGTTDIGTMDTRTGEVVLGSEWFGLDGRRIQGQPSQKGVYINNGKKMIVK